MVNRLYRTKIFKVVGVRPEDLLRRKIIQYTCKEGKNRIIVDGKSITSDKP